ncbi:putative baseplate assembly protein [Streptomyces griseoruber]|uniref:putative baseplate assembly protein n=1 Tax=Streptomyces griseoruber TaxID=1943 RepID=UPI0037A88C71
MNDGGDTGRNHGGTTPCGTGHRRGDVRTARLNGVDAVEAHDDGLTLVVTFLGKAPRRLAPGNVRIDGGRRITGVHVTEVTIERAEDADLDDRAFVVVDRTGDTSPYTLSVVEPDAYGRPGTEPLAGFDPRYSRADFVFHPQCPARSDCVCGCGGEHDVRPAPVIDYTARDYATLRRQLLDRMTLVAPSWVERHVPDLGTTVVELLAYAGDQLEYQLDAVATEAYLHTARRRTSVRRHVRLIDYLMHDGCNARAAVTLSVGDEMTLRPGTFRFAAIDVSQVDPVERPDLRAVVTERALAALPPAARTDVFEPLASGETELRPTHNRIRFHTWGDDECCLPRGATSATLVDEGLYLVPGDLLVIEEVLGPRTGAAADADPAHRQVVRLTSVTPACDALYDRAVVEVTWADEDALAFSACLTTTGGPACERLVDVTVARGNVLLVDHGRDLTFCGGPPEEYAVPSAPAPPPVCGSGCCPDRPEQGPAGEAIVGLMTVARRGEQLTEEQVTTLRGLVGRAALDRAGLDAGAPAADQAASLDTLLAQLRYPGTVEPFRPEPTDGPVTHRTAYPDPALVSSGQAELLDGIAARARARVTALWRAARPLTEEETAELRLLVGQAVLDRLGFAHDEARALRDLLLRYEALLGAKIRRLARLSRRAREGEVLGGWLLDELAQTWGPSYADGLRADDPRLAGPASAALTQDPRAALPAVTVTAYAPDGTPAGEWTPRRDLLTATPDTRAFVGEAEQDGRLALRFGDGVNGEPPPAGGRIAVRHRVGNGAAGNVGAEAIGHLVLCDGGDDAVTLVRNPLPARGGTEPEALDEVRRLAPLQPHRVRLRAVTADDYAELASAVPGVQRAAADFRWTGTGQEVHVAVDALGTGAPGAKLLDRVAHTLDGVRRIGHDVVVRPATAVPVDLELKVCAAAGHQRGHVRDAVRRTVLALFAPDAVTFGDPVRISRVVAAAAAVPGVTSVLVTRLRRLFAPDAGELDDGLLRIGPLEVAQLEDDRDRPENGRLHIEIGGGR